MRPHKGLGLERKEQLVLLEALKRNHQKKKKSHKKVALTSTWVSQKCQTDNRKKHSRYGKARKHEIV